MASSDSGGKYESVSNLTLSIGFHTWKVHQENKTRNVSSCHRLPKITHNESPLVSAAIATKQSQSDLHALDTAAVGDRGQARVGHGGEENSALEAGESPHGGAGLSGGEGSRSHRGGSSNEGRHGCRAKRTMKTAGARRRDGGRLEEEWAQRASLNGVGNSLHKGGGANAWRSKCFRILQESCREYLKSADSFTLGIAQGYCIVIINHM